MYFICACMYVATQLQFYTSADTCNAAWVVSDSYIASYLFPYFLCQFLLPFLKFNFLKLLYNINQSVLVSRRLNPFTDAYLIIFYRRLLTRALTW